jgi:hypothetical protein
MSVHSWDLIDKGMAFVVEYEVVCQEVTLEA